MNECTSKQLNPNGVGFDELISSCHHCMTVVRITWLPQIPIIASILIHLVINLPSPTVWSILHVLHRTCLLKTMPDWCLDQLQSSQGIVQTIYQVFHFFGLKIAPTYDLLGFSLKDFRALYKGFNAISFNNFS